MFGIRFLITGRSLDFGVKSTCMWLALFMVSSLVGQPCAAEDAGDIDVRKSVVKIEVTKVSPNEHEPWKRQATSEAYGTGVVIDGNRILTNAHVVGHAMLKRFNDVEIKNLKHLVELMRDSKEEYFVFEFAGDTAETYVFEREPFLAATEEVLDDNGIRQQGTPELLKVWNQEPSK